MDINIIDFINTRHELYLSSSQSISGGKVVQILNQTIFSANPRILNEIRNVYSKGKFCPVYIEWDISALHISKYDIAYIFEDPNVINIKLCGIINNVPYEYMINTYDNQDALGVESIIIKYKDIVIKGG